MHIRKTRSLLLVDEDQYIHRVSLYIGLCALRYAKGSDSVVVLAAVPCKVEHPHIILLKYAQIFFDFGFELRSGAV